MQTLNAIYKVGVLMYCKLKPHKCTARSMKVVIVVGLNLLRKERENSPAKDPAVSFACFEL